MDKNQRDRQLEKLRQATERELASLKTMTDDEIRLLQAQRKAARSSSYKGGRFAGERQS